MEKDLVIRIFFHILQHTNKATDMKMQILRDLKNTKPKDIQILWKSAVNGIEDVMIAKNWIRNFAEMFLMNRGKFKLKGNPLYYTLTDKQTRWMKGVYDRLVDTYGGVTFVSNGYSHIVDSQTAIKRIGFRLISTKI
jgi:hypothetical protein